MTPPKPATNAAALTYLAYTLWTFEPEGAEGALKELKRFQAFARQPEAVQAAIRALEEAKTGVRKT